MTMTHVRTFLLSNKVLKDQERRFNFAELVPDHFVYTIFTIKYVQTNYNQNIDN